MLCLRAPSEQLLSKWYLLYREITKLKPNQTHNKNMVGATSKKFFQGKYVKTIE